VNPIILRAMISVLYLLGIISLDELVLELESSYCI
jgi:hypothetical protein